MWSPNQNLYKDGESRMREQEMLPGWAAFWTCGGGHEHRTRNSQGPLYWEGLCIHGGWQGKCMFATIENYLKQNPFKTNQAQATEMVGRSWSVIRDVRGMRELKFHPPGGKS